MQYYRRELSSSAELLLGSDSSSFEMLENMLEQEYLHENKELDANVSRTISFSDQWLEKDAQTKSPPSYADSRDSLEGVSNLSSYVLPMIILEQSAKTISSTMHSSFDMPALLDLPQVDIQAEQRLKVRLEIAHWQCKWEMVMARMINKVIEKKQIKRQLLGHDC